MLSSETQNLTLSLGFSVSKTTITAALARSSAVFMGLEMSMRTTMSFGTCTAASTYHGLQCKHLREFLER